MALRRNDESLTRFLACFKKPTSRLFIGSAVLECFFYAYSAIVDSFVIVSFFLKNIIFRIIIVD